MTRSVVFKTPGQLDVRSLTVMGLNSKPNATHPIGFFGTGLKYAIAVLSRHNIPITFYINGTKWTVEVEDTNFRGKEFKQLFLRRNRKLLGLGKQIALPFTTELGKTWELWQAFRELESNTRDEKGMTFVAQKGANDHYFIKHGVEPEYQTDDKNFTYVCVESEAFVQEYFDREKTFLPGGMTQREGTEQVQFFDRPSKSVYYRGIRVHDLPENEPSEMTYNILTSIELTEDRTAKDAWTVKYIIANAIAQLKDVALLKKAITAPKATYERGMTFSYVTPSKEFLDVAEEVPEKDRNYNVNTTYEAYRPKPVKAQDTRDWIPRIVEFMRIDEWDQARELAQAHREDLIQILERAQAEIEKERSNNEQVRDEGAGESHDDGGEVEGSTSTRSHVTATGNSLLDREPKDDYIPF